MAATPGDALQHRRVAARHHGERALARALDPARDRRIEEGNVQGCEFRGGGARRLAADGGGVDHHAVRPQAVFQRGDHFEQVGVGAEREDHQFAAARQVGRIGGDGDAEFLAESVGLFACAVPDGREVTHAVEVPRHGRAHGAEADDAGFHGGLLTPLSGGELSFVRGRGIGWLWVGVEYRIMILCVGAGLLVPGDL